MSDGFARIDATIKFVHQSLLDSRNRASFKLRLLLDNAPFPITSNAFFAVVRVLDPNACAHVLTKVRGADPTRSVRDALQLEVSNTPPCSECRRMGSDDDDEATLRKMEPMCSTMLCLSAEVRECYTTACSADGTMQRTATSANCEHRIVQQCGACYKSNCSRTLSEMCHKDCCSAVSGPCRHKFLPPVHIVVGSIGHIHTSTSPALTWGYARGVRPRMRAADTACELLCRKLEHCRHLCTMFRAARYM